MKVTKISDTVLNILANCEMQGNALRLTEQLDRKVYTEVNKIIEAAGGNWNKKAKAHTFATGNAIDAIDPIVLSGQIIKPSDMGQFDTPLPLARDIVDRAEIEAGMSVLEPSAGVGNILQALCEKAKLLLYACEIDEHRHAILKQGFGIPVKKADFLTMSHASAPKMDRVVMNPPFAKQADIDHVLHAYKFLKPTGILVAIMSAGVTFRTNRKAEEFRGRFEMEVSPLPASSFKASGTEVNTVVVKIAGGQ